MLSPSFNNTFEQLCKNTRNSKILRENIYMIFLNRKSLFNNVSDQNVFICQRFSNFCCIFCDELSAQLCQQNIYFIFIYLKQKSDTGKHIMVEYQRIYFERKEYTLKSEVLCEFNWKLNAVFHAVKNFMVHSRLRKCTH